MLIPESDRRGVIILFAWLVVGIVASLLVAIAIGGQEGFAVFRQADYSTLGSVGSFLVIMAGFPCFLVPGLLWTVVSLIDGTTELAIGVHFANNIGSILLFNITGSAVTTLALFTISEYHATYGALSVLVAIPMFLAIAYGVFKRKALTRFPELPQDRR